MPQMVHCPQCKTAVGVSDDAGGSRVGCPHCGQAFIVPGFEGGTGYDTGGRDNETGSGKTRAPKVDDDDDDWLNLAPSTPRPSATSPRKPAAPTDVPSPQSTSGSEDDDWGLDLPALQPVKPRPAAADPVLPDHSVWPDEDDEPATADEDIAATFDERPAGKNSDGDEIQYQKEYRVRCPSCGTQTNVTAAQAGKKVRCRDCFTMVMVPRPPRVPRKAKIDMEAAPSFQFSESTQNVENRPADPFRKSASELLEAASKIEEDEPKPDLDVPKIRDWATSVFGIFLQIGVMAHWLILSTMASAVAFVALAIDSPMLVVGLFAAGGFFAAVVLACGFAIMQSIANEEESVTEWPVTLEPTEWITPLIFCFAAAGLSYGPGWFIGYMTFGNSLTTVCFSMISTFLIFPFVLLSMLDMQNIFVPFSPDVGRSVTRCEEAWGGFYFSSGIVFFITFLIFAASSMFAPPAAAVLGIFTAVSAVFIYFAMLGRLALSIGHSVNAEAKANDIQQQREREREQKKNQ
ncbi:ribosomal protein S27E [Rhodopirellula rubra]|uniref:Ribosomal protein S27E n=2 Tax=Aporhodopirellula rubra TaxID=980271 RepID=A0A7W5H6A0_9BACT|nr:ribosomal protein S27E [Aporhodopirellula rubra]